MKRLLITLLVIGCSTERVPTACEDVVNFYDIYNEVIPEYWSTQDALTWFSDYDLWVILRDDQGDVLFRGFQSDIDASRFTQGQVVQFYAWFGEPDLGVNHETLQGCYITKAWTIVE